MKPEHSKTLHFGLLFVFYTIYGVVLLTALVNPLAEGISTGSRVEIGVFAVNNNASTWIFAPDHFPMGALGVAVPTLILFGTFIHLLQPILLCISRLQTDQTERCLSCQNLIKKRPALLRILGMSGSSVALVGILLWLPAIQHWNSQNFPLEQVHVNGDWIRFLVMILGNMVVQGMMWAWSQIMIKDASLSNNPKDEPNNSYTRVSIRESMDNTMSDEDTKLLNFDI